jgi:lipid-A-disaccharide synthase
MVVAYKTARLTAFILTFFKLMKAPFFAQPNLLANRLVVEEWFQDDATVERLAAGLQSLLSNPTRVTELENCFTQIHHTLKRDASAQAARVVWDAWKATAI